MKKSFCIALLAAILSGCTGVHIANELRAPAYSLITIDPYTSAWSGSDKLYDSEVIHWTEKPFHFLGLLRVDGQVYRFMGMSDDTPAVQHRADVQATRTIYDFTCGPVDLRLTFTAPFLPDDIGLMFRPVNYISYEIVPNDGRRHSAEIYFETSQDWARNTPDQECASETYADDNFRYVKCGTLSQNILGDCGDDLRIDWGYFMMAADKKAAAAATGSSESLREAFASEGTVSCCDAGNMLAMAVKIGEVGRKGKEGYVMAGYDDIYSIRYFGENVRPYWNRSGNCTIEEQFALAAADFSRIKKECEAFDNKLMSDAVRAGGQHYAELCALAYRQTMAAHKLIETPEGDLALLSKECDSNGSIGTVDLSYPSLPIFLIYNTTLAKALVDFIFHYSECGKWTQPFPAHDVGTYPIAEGQTFIGDMPVEEAGNMLLITAAICRAEGDVSYALRHWDVLGEWADYLTEHGADPVDQLCTDDFAGRLARNTNLSAKAILAIAAYADMAGMAGKDDVAEKYLKTARDLAAWWKTNAFQGDHYSLAFGKEDSWSQKYNLVWDKVLGYGIFDSDIAETEVAYYLTKQNEFGLPLDCRRNYTKSDWVMWTAALAPDMETFQALTDPVHHFFNTTVDRVPMTDWYDTDSPTYRHFKARSVVGGYFMRMLDDKMNNR